MSDTTKKGLFVTDDGQNLVFTFILVSSLFLLWGFCNGMIDVMDKHFQEELGLSKSQSAWVQFAHYLGYFLMSMPAGWLASKLGYKGGIITGLLIVAVGGFWFIPATHINAMVHEGTVSSTTAFVAFLAGVCADRHRADVSGDHRQSLHHGAGRSKRTRPRASIWRNPATASAGSSAPSSAACSSTGKDAAGKSTGSETLYIPYVGVAVVVIVIAVIFYFANVPDIKIEGRLPPGRRRRRAFRTPSGAHPHFVMAVAAQFFYVAAQAGIFSFFINYMTSEVPAIPASWNAAMNNLAANAGWLHDWLPGWFETGKTGVLAISNKGRREPGVAGFHLLPDRPLHRRRHR